MVAQQLELEEHAYELVFQSRFGREERLQPYADATLKQLPANGVRSVQVICPGFSADCLETLEEIARENRDYFLAAGGEKFDYIPCLNSDEGHLNALATIATKNLADWLSD